MGGFRKGMFELLAWTETKLKGKGDVSLCGVNGIIASVQMERVRARVIILLNDLWQIDFRCVSSRILWSNFRFSRVKVCVVVGYSPNEGNSEEMDKIVNQIRIRVKI